MADDTTLQLGGDPSGAVAAIREVAAEMRTMADRSVQAFESFGQKFDASVTKKVPDGADKATKSVGLFDQQWKKMTASFSAANLIDRGITTLTSGLVDILQQARATATTMTDLSDRTGHSVEFLQRAGYAAKVAGFDFEKFSAGAFTLGVKLAGGSGSVRDAVDALGLSWNGLLAMNVDDRLSAVTTALGQMENPTERNRIAVTLFGGAAKTATDAAAAGWEKVGESAIVASRAQLEAIKRGETAWKQWTAWIYGVGMKAFGDLAGDITGTAASLDSLTEAEMQAFTVQQHLGRGHLYLVELQRERTKGQHDIELSTRGATSATEKYAAAAQQARQDLADYNAEERQQILAAIELGASVEDLVADFGGSAAAIKLLQAETKKQEEADKAAADAVRKHAEAQRSLAKAVDDAKFALRKAGIVEGQESLKKAVSDTSKQIAAEFEGLSRTGTSHFGILESSTANATRAWEPFKKAVKDSGAELSKLHSAGPSFSSSMGTAMKGLPQVMMNAAQGGGDVGKSVGSSLGSALGDWAGKAAGPALGNMFGKTIGGAVGTMFGPVGTMVGGFLGSKIGNLAGKVFGGIFGDKGKKEAESLRNEFIKSAGGLTKLQEEAQKAGVSLDALMKAKNADQVKAAIEEITKKLDAHSQKLASAEQVAAKYGITLAEMGQGFRQSKLDETALGFAQDFDVLKTAGTDVKVITDKMGGSFAEYVQQVIDAGGTIPKELKPIAAAMIEQGSLTVKNGAEYQRLTATKIDLERQLAEAMKDTSATGVAKQAELKAAIAQTNTAIDGTSKNFDNIDDLPWAENLNDMFKDVMKSIGDLVGYLKDMLPAGFGVAATAGQNFGSKITAGLGGAIVAAGSLGTKVGQIDWDGMAREAKDALRDVEDSVNAVSFGHSPGGLKEYPLLLGKATAAMRTWRRDWASELREVEQRVNETGLPAMGRATQFAAQATGTIATNATAAAARAPSVNVEAFADLFVAVDPVSGAVRQVTDARQIERLVQQGLREGRFSLPVRNVVGRAA